MQKAKAFLQEQERLQVSELSDAVAKSATHFQLLRTTSQRWKAAEEEVEARLVEFKGGRSPINVVLQSQQRRADAQIAYYRALGEYNKSLNYVDYLKGTMLANSNITLAEGPWNKKAYWDALERARERSAGKELQYGVSRPGVVRRGRLQDADAAMGIIGSGASTFGETLPPDGIILEGPDEGVGFEGQSDREPIEINDTPLGEMGTPIEMLSPEVGIGPNVEQIERGTAAPDAGLPAELPMPAPDPLPDDNHSFLRPLNVPDSTMVSPMSHESDVEISYAPQPVRRKPVPSAP